MEARCGGRRGRGGGEVPRPVGRRGRSRRAGVAGGGGGDGGFFVEARAKLARCPSLCFTAAAPRHADAAATAPAPTTIPFPAHPPGRPAAHLPPPPFHSPPQPRPVVPSAGARG